MDGAFGGGVSLSVVGYRSRWWGIALGGGGVVGIVLGGGVVGIALGSLLRCRSGAPKNQPRSRLFLRKGSVSADCMLVLVMVYSLR